MWNKSAFKAYDIRGKYGEEIDENLAYFLGKARGKYFISKYGKDGKMLVASDTRFHNNSLIEYFCSGLIKVGFPNFYFANSATYKPNPDANLKSKYGVCSTSMSYYIVQNSFEAGMCWTASHNPASDVGAKVFDRNTVFIQTSFLEEIFNKEYNTDEVPVLVDFEIRSHKMENEKIKSYFNFLSSKFEQQSGNRKPSDLSFVVDYCNGAGVAYEKMFFDIYCPNHIGLNDYSDGRFPVHESETQDKNNYSQIIETIKTQNLDFGVMFDGDVDRIGIVTNEGNIIAGDVITAIVAKQILTENTKNKSDCNPIIIYDVMSSKIIQDTALELGAEPLVNKMGRFFMNETLNAKKAIFGGECSGHYFLGNHGGYEMPLLILYYVILEAIECGDFESMYHKYHKYYKSPVIDRKVSDKDLALSNIKKKFIKYNPLEIDGINIYSDEFRLTVRKSNTSDKIRYNVESQDQSKVEEILTKISHILDAM